MLDANAQLGSTTDDGVGGHAAAWETPSGLCFREWLNKLGLFAPSTFFGHDGQCAPTASEPTWVSPKGDGYRIDYVALPQEWKLASLTPSVLQDFTTANIGHWPVQVECAMQCSSQDQRHTRHGSGIPTDGDCYPEASKALLRQCVQHLPAPDWSCNIHEHTQKVYEAVILTAKEANRQAPKQRRCRAFLSDTSKFWLECERSFGKACRSFERLWRRALLGTCLRAWAGQTPFRTREGWSLRQVSLMLQRAVHLRHFAKRQLRNWVAWDKTQFVQARFSRICSATQPFDSKAFFKAISVLRPPGKRIRKPFQPLVVDPAQPEAGPADLALLQAEHFASLEGGVQTSAEQYVKEANQRYAHAPPDATFCLADLPTLCEVECGLRKGKNAKAPGPCGIPDWVWKLDPVAAARAFYPIYLKTHVRLCEPVQFKSTCLIAMFKGKGAVTCVANFRAIALMDGPGKRLRRGVRPALLAALPENDLMQGGIPGSLLQAAHHTVRTYVSLAAHAQVSSAVLFLDVASAYYRVLRQALWDSEPEDDAALCALLQRLQVQPAVVSEVCSWIYQTNLLQKAPEHTSRLIKEFLSGTFFQMRGAAGTIATNAGTRPGDSVADLLFALVQADFLNATQTALESEELLSDPLQMRAELAPRLLAPVWADDTAMLFADADANALLCRMKSVLTVVNRSFVIRGMQPNYSRGKTELLLTFRGKGAPALRRRVHVWDGGKIPFVGANQEVIQVGCVQSYLHLGGRVEERPTVLADIVQHIATGSRQVRPLARPFLRSPHIPLASRRLCLQSLALSAASCTAATWGPMTVQEREAWRKGYTALHRLLGADDRWTGAPSLPDEKAVCRCFGSPSPCAFLKGQRLMHFCRLVPAHETLYALLRADLCYGEISWLGLLKQDLAWLAANAKVPEWALKHFPDGALRWAVEQPVQLRAAVRKALRGCHSASHEPLWDNPQKAPSEASGVQFRCAHCERCFDSQQKRAAHQFAQHRVRCQAAEYVSGSCCPVCFTQFWTHRRLCRHLQHDSLSCLTRLVEHDYRSVAEGYTRSDGPCQSLPAVRLIGPVLPLAKPLEELAFELMESPDCAERIRTGWHSPAVARWLEARETAQLCT